MTSSQPDRDDRLQKKTEPSVVLAGCVRYWEIKGRWLAGEHEAVVAERKSQLDRRMLASS